MIEYIRVNTRRRVELQDITAKIEELVHKSNVEEGVCVLFCPHTTAGLTINEAADPAVKGDIIDTLNRLIPCSGDYSHQEGNADSHIKASVFGSSLTVFIDNHRLVLGRWQGIYLFEGDGPRPREIWVKIIRG